MPLFFFHLRDQGHFLEDSKGVDLPDLHAALEEVLRTDRELAGEPIGSGGLEFEIADSSGCVVLKVPIKERQRNPGLVSRSSTRHAEYLSPGPKYLH